MAASSRYKTYFFGMISVIASLIRTAHRTKTVKLMSLTDNIYNAPKRMRHFCTQRPRFRGFRPLLIRNVVLWVRKNNILALLSFYLLEAFPFPWPWTSQLFIELLEFNKQLHHQFKQRRNVVKKNDARSLSFRHFGEHPFWV